MPPPTQRRMRLPESAMRPFSPIATVAARKAPLCYLRACPQAPSLRLSADDLRIAASFLVAVQKVRLPRLSLRCLVLVPHSRSGNLRTRPSRPVPLRPPPPSPGAQAAQRARQIALAGLYWGPILFLGATIALIVSLWRGQNLSGVYYAIVVVLAGLGAASGWVLQRRLGE